MPESLWFRMAVALLSVLGLALAVSMLLSVQRFFNERRESASRILKEVRIHRAETRLLRSELSELSDAIGALFAPSPESLQNTSELESRQGEVSLSQAVALRKTDGRLVPVQQYAPTLESKLRSIDERLTSIEANNELAFTETLEQSAIRAKQLISMLEVQRLRLETLERQTRPPA